ncbi:lipopolysaccharide biosynthesis protein [Paenibacillus sp. S150]|uniref:lipopolysaccharide biosynthesis protein n=1 Tax=Paenibacillus sp. S150 TaxID=2749826 RepID=UPI001C5660FE|nr:hypothetical protein [Paenibacillus sp. S150]MBW4084531.1 hypothetical protein [Paenibacillus sp. S150]
MLKLLKKIKHFIYVFGANFFSMISGILMSIILPYQLGVTQYGYWSLFLLYFGYSGFMHFGFNDGVYLMYGGKRYENLDLKRFRGYFIFLVLLQFVIGTIYACVLFNLKEEYMFVLGFATINMIVSNLNLFFLYINQITQKYKNYALSIFIEKFGIIVFLLLMLLWKSESYKLFVIYFTVTKVVVLSYYLFTNKNIILGKYPSLKNLQNDAILVYKAGFSLFIANSVAVLIASSGRFIFTYFSSVKELGLYSFAINILSFVQIFNTSLSTILYPMICNFEKFKLKIYFEKLSRLITYSSFLFLMFYFPATWIIEIFFNDYIEVLKFLQYLFPFFIYQMHITIVLHPLIKAVRKEKVLFWLNIIGVTSTILLSFIFLYIDNSLQSIAIATTISYAIWNIATDLWLRNYLKMKYEDILPKVCITLIFIFLVNFIESHMIAFILYVLIVSLYFLYRKSELLNSFLQIYKFVTNKEERIEEEL